MAVTDARPPFCSLLHRSSALLCPFEEDEKGLDEKVLAVPAKDPR